MRGQYDHKSAYIHGNELALWEMLPSEDASTVTLNWHSDAISARRTLGELLMYTLDLMVEFQKVSGIQFPVKPMADEFDALFITDDWRAHDENAVGAT